MNKYFNLEKRKELQFLLSEGFSLRVIQESLSVTRMTLYTELKRGLTEEEYTNKRYIKYSVIRAIEAEIEKCVGTESIKELRKAYGVDDDDGNIYAGSR